MSAFVGELYNEANTERLKMTLISEATRRNWKKLNSSIDDGKLCSRANKKLSRRKIIPYEYLEHQSNRPLLDAVIHTIEEDNTTLVDALHSLAAIQLTKCGLSIDDKESYAYRLLHDYGGSFSPIFKDIEIPDDEHDFLGVVYQSLLLEGDKNETGSYYTPSSIAKKMLSGCTFEHGETLYDPCCGSGSILLAADVRDYHQLYGSDIDGHALFICKVNLLSKYPSADGFPGIILSDFLLQFRNEGAPGGIDKKFDYIATNPPWGSKAIKAFCCHPTVTSGESASMFAIESCKRIKPAGLCSFLLPKSLINIAVHRDFRKYLLDHCLVNSIQYYSNIFSGVTTEFVNIKFQFSCSPNSNNKTKVQKWGETFEVPQCYFRSCEDYVFRCAPEIDRGIISKVREVCCEDLSRSEWALGIVTGDNKKKVFSEYKEGLEPVFTGKEVQPFRLSKPNKYIFFDPGSFQQTAREEIYRNPEKLVYKFVSKKLVFAIDETSSLFLNSANILIPKVPSMSTKSVLAFLNSALYQYLYMTLFDDCKILKGNLLRLPFPLISKEQDSFLVNLVERILDGVQLSPQIDDAVFNIFGLSQLERERVMGVVHG